MPRGPRTVVVVVAALVFSTVLLPVRPGHAQEPEAPAGPTLVVTASIASLDKVAAAAKDIGLGDLPMLSAGFIEQKMPFIGAGGLASDRPLGVLFYAGSTGDLEKSATFVLPVNAGKAQLKTFIDNGAQPVAGRTDLVTLEGVGFRRAKDQFIFGQIPGAVAAVREDVLTSAYEKDRAGLARIDVDIAAFKRAVPERYEAFFAELDDELDPDDQVRLAWADLVIGVIRELTRVGVSVGRAEAGGLRLGIVAAPFEAPQEPPVKFSRPGFPEGTLFRADLAHAPTKALARVTSTVSGLIERSEDLARLPAAQQEQVKTLAAEVARFLLGGETGSAGVEAVGQQFVVYWITRQAADAPKRNLAEEITSLVARAGEVAKVTQGGKPLMSAESYPSASAAGTSVHRLVLLEEGKPELYVDVVQRDGSVLMAISPDGEKFVERLVGLKDAGEAAALVSGWMDMSALTGTVLMTAGGELKNAGKGERLEWTATPDPAGGALRIDVNLPKTLVQNLPELVKLFQ